MTTTTIQFTFTTDAPQSEAVLRRTIRRKLDDFADSYDGEVTAVLIEVAP